MATIQKSVLVIGYVWPEPNSSAAGRHILSIMRSFIEVGWQVEFASPAQHSEHAIKLIDEHISSQQIKLNCDSFDRYISELQPDIVLFDRFMMEEQFGWRVEKHCPNALKVLDTEDLQCLRHARYQAHKAQRAFAEENLFNDIAKREIAAILRCDLSLIISSFEMDLLINTFNINRELLFHLPFMVKLDALPENKIDFTQRTHCIAIGNFRHAPNWDMVLHLQHLWSKIYPALPNIECRIYGAYPPPKATALHNEKTKFLIKGWAENALQVIQQARLCLAPIQFGAGLKGKLLDALMANTPSITTPVGAEGMDIVPWAGAIANNDHEFIAATIDLYQNQSNWQRVQSRSKALLQQYDSTQLAPKLIDAINHCQHNLTQHRLRNFTGAMLKHHHHASTKYMSQWIAAKNK